MRAIVRVRPVPNSPGAVFEKYMTPDCLEIMEQLRRRGVRVRAEWQGSIAIVTASRDYASYTEGQKDWERRIRTFRTAISKRELEQGVGDALAAEFRDIAWHV